MIRIDVKPHSFPSCFRIDGDGTVPVAIFGEQGFEVHDIDERSLVFEGLIVKRKNNGSLQCATEFVDGGPYVDLVCHFVDDPTSWTGAEPEGSLTGETLAGTSFEGVGDICLTND